MNSGRSGDAPRLHPIYGPIKRLLDLVGAAGGLLLTSPLLLAIALAVGWTMGRPIFYRQRRPGLHGRIFVILKFRTMTQAIDAADPDRDDGARLTPLGRWLRRTSLDELPELWNVLRGEMALVGPRPLLVEYLDRYSPQQARRHEVRPGITGWAQINGRNAISWEQKFALDVWYVEREGLLLDLKILVKTVLLVLRAQGISADGHSTVPPFMGSEGDTPLETTQEPQGAEREPR